MTEHFSPRIVYEIASQPSPPTTGRTRRQDSTSSRFYRQFFGDRALERIITSFEPDLIYADSALYGAQYRLLSFISRRRTPMIVHLRGDWWREYWAWFSTAPWSRRLRGTQQYTYNWMSLISAKKITPICKWLDQVVRHHIPCKDTTVVYQGVDPTQFRPGPYTSHRRPSVAIIQNHEVYPKVVGLLNFRQVVQNLPGIDFYIAEGEHTGQTYLDMVKETYSRSENVHFVKGVNSPEEVAKMLAASDCYVLASGLDCCPTTVLEASLMQKPVLASKVGGVPEIILQNQTGWTIEDRLTKEWVEKINLVVSDRKLSKKMGEKGRHWVSEQFGWEHIAGQVETMLRQKH